MSTSIQNLCNPVTICVDSLLASASCMPCSLLQLPAYLLGSSGNRKPYKASTSNNPCAASHDSGTISFVHCVSLCLSSPHVPGSGLHMYCAEFEHCRKLYIAAFRSMIGDNSLHCVSAVMTVVIMVLQRQLINQLTTSELGTILQATGFLACFNLFLLVCTCSAGDRISGMLHSVSSSLYIYCRRQGFWRASFCFFYQPACGGP